MNVYDEQYFLHGRQSGRSLYENYRWLPDLTIPMVREIINHLTICTGETILDFGCARGYIVKAFRQQKFMAYGVDISEWAIENADPEIREFVFLASSFEYPESDWIIAKDVLEHIPNVQYTIDALMRAADVGLFAIVPLASRDGEPYVVPDYELDVTHIHRFTLASWVDMFLRPGWSVEASYRVPGIKDNYKEWERGNGFITCRRILE